MKRGSLSNRIRRAALLLAVLLLFSAAVQAGGTIRLQELISLPQAPETESDYVVLMEAKSGTVLYEKNAMEKAYPASITKVMTALLTMENCRMDENVTFSYRATHEIGPGSSSIARTEGEIMTVEQCLYGLMVASANEVAQGLAEHISGSLESFVALMNLRAQQLGAVNTHFANAHGYHTEDHYTCAYDMALFMREAIRYDRLVEIMGTERYQIPPTNKHDEITYMKSSHPLLTGDDKMKYPYALAGKTGYTDEALCTLVTYARQGDMDLICVTMHAATRTMNGNDTVALFNYGFQNFKCYNLSSREAVLENDASGFLGKNLINFAYSEEAYCTLPNGMTPESLSSEIVFLGSQARDDVLATRIYTLGGMELGRCDLKVLPMKDGLAIKPIVSVVPSRNEILRQEHFGLPLIYWILIGGGVVLLLVIWLSIWLTVRAVKRYKRRKAHAKQTMNRMNDDRFPPLLY